MGDVRDLEKEFEKLIGTVGKQIRDKLAQASKLLGEACDLADTHGIPFSAGISQLGQCYIPSTFNEKFGDLDQGRIEELTDVSSYDLDEGGYGWQHSDVC